MAGGGVVEDKEDIRSASLSGVAVASMDDVGGRADVVAAWACACFWGVCRAEPSDVCASEGVVHRDLNGGRGRASREKGLLGARPLCALFVCRCRLSVTVWAFVWGFSGDES